MDNNQINKGGNGPKMNMPKFNMNWIYILAILALGLLYFSSVAQGMYILSGTRVS